MTAQRLILSLALATTTPLLGCDDGSEADVACDGGACPDGEITGEGGMGGTGAGGADGPGGMGGAGEGGAGGAGPVVAGDLAELAQASELGLSTELFAYDLDGDGADELISSVYLHRFTSRPADALDGRLLIRRSGERASGMDVGWSTLLDGTDDARMALGAIADADGDGAVDLILTARASEDDAAPILLWVDGSVTGEHDLLRRMPTGETDQLGRALAAAALNPDFDGVQGIVMRNPNARPRAWGGVLGDHNADGILDYLVTYDEEEGSKYGLLYFGPFDGTESFETPDAVIGPLDVDRIAGDVDGDGDVDYGLTTGSGAFGYFDDPAGETPVQLLDAPRLPDGRRCARRCDVDGDGLGDFFCADGDVTEVFLAPLDASAAYASLEAADLQVHCLEEARMLILHRAAGQDDDAIVQVARVSLSPGDSYRSAADQPAFTAPRALRRLHGVTGDFDGDDRLDLVLGSAYASDAGLILYDVVGALGLDAAE